MKKKFRIKKQAIFNSVSIILILVFTANYAIRFFNYMILDKKAVVLSEIFAERIVESIDSYGRDTTIEVTNNIYRFIDRPRNNYVQYMGYTWRIVRINEDKSITLVMEESVTSLAYGDTRVFTSSQISDWLNIKADVDHSGIFEKTLSEEHLTNTITCLDTLSDINNITCFDRDTTNKISLLSVKDYYDAGGENSFLNNGNTFWTSNVTHDRKFWYIADDGKVGIGEHNAYYTLRPVITLKAGVKVAGGHGFADDPYTIENRTINNTDDLYVGEFISYNDILWRIISKNENYIKVVTDDCLTDEDEECIEMIYSEIDNTFDMVTPGNLLTYLNNTFYNSLENKEFILRHIFFNGTYARLEDYDYTTSFASYNKAHVGLLTLADPFAFDIPNIFLANRPPSNDVGIYVVNNNKALFEDLVISPYSVRPVIHLRPNIKITEGNGSYFDPYILGGLLDEE